MAYALTLLRLQHCCSGDKFRGAAGGPACTDGLWSVLKGSGGPLKGRKLTLHRTALQKREVRLLIRQGAVAHACMRPGHLRLSHPGAQACRAARERQSLAAMRHGHTGRMRGR
jgi:hypothetical protein